MYLLENLVDNPPSHPPGHPLAAQLSNLLVNQQGSPPIFQQANPHRNLQNNQPQYPLEILANNRPGYPPGSLLDNQLVFLLINRQINLLVCQQTIRPSVRPGNQQLYPQVSQAANLPYLLAGNLLHGLL